jgi:hypothetical protein
MLWVVAGTVGTGYDFYITTKLYTWADVSLGIEGWGTDPVAVQIAVVLATAASLEAHVPGRCLGNYPANCPVTGGPGMSDCPAIGSPAVVSWGEDFCDRFTIGFVLPQHHHPRAMPQRSHRIDQFSAVLHGSAWPDSGWLRGFTGFKE